MAPVATRKDWLSIGFLGLVWGGTFMTVSIALEGYGPLTVATARTTLGALALLGLCQLTGQDVRLKDRQTWAYVIPIGLLSTAIPFFMLSWGQQYVPSAFAGLTMAALPLFVMPLAHMFSDEHMTMRGVIGVVLGFFGAVVLIGPGALTFENNSIDLLARLACLGAAIAYAVSSVMTRRCPPIEPLTLATLALAVGAAALVPAMLVVEGVPSWVGTRPSLAIVLLGLVPTALATLIRMQVIRRAGSVFLTLVNYQVPIWSMIFGAIVLSEALPFRFFVALGLILFGLAVSQWSSLKSLLRGS